MSFDPANSYGKLPVGWRMDRLKFFAEVRNSNVDKVISEGEVPVRLCNYTDVYYNDRITSDMDFMEGSASDAELARFCLKSGQVLLTKDSESWQDIGVPAFVAEDMPGVVCGYHLSILDPGPELDGGYLAWLCRSAPLNDQFKLGSNGVTRFGLGQYPLKNALVAVPPIEVQQRIARFLNEKTARIDALIEKKQALLDRLAEKRQALITRAVTKGLRSNVPMKQSGVDWLGDVPSHWALVPFKWRCRIRSGQVDPREDGFAELPLIAPDHIESASGRLVANVGSAEEQGAISGKYLCYPGDILYSKIRPALRKVLLSDSNCLCSADMYAIDSGEDVDECFLFYFLLTDAFTCYAELESLRVAMPKVNREAIGSFVLPVPPKAEQEAIAQACAEFDASERGQSAQVRGSVDRLVEYRSALITAAVTGQIPELNG
jgi:type I restriction enzyme S subunit